MTSVAALAVSATGCGANESENLGSSQAAFTVDACAAASANQTFSGKIDPAHVSPRTYNTCYKGYVVDIENLDPNYTGEGNSSDARISVEYADTPITDRTTCEHTELTAVFYQWLGGSTDANAGGPGSWNAITTETRLGGWLFGRCYMGVELTAVVPGMTYRVAATVRTPSNATRKLSIGTYKPVNIH